MMEVGLPPSHALPSSPIDHFEPVATSGPVTSPALNLALKSIAQKFVEQRSFKQNQDKYLLVVSDLAAQSIRQSTVLADVINTFHTQMESRSNYFSRIQKNNTGSVSAALMARTNVSLHTHSHDHEDGHHHAHEHNHEGGLISVDLDETAHGGNALVVYGKDLFLGHPEAIVHEFQEKAKEMAEKPLEFAGHEMIPDGVGEFAASVATSGVMLPLAGFAAYAGIKEAQHANAEIKETLHGLKDLKRDAGYTERLQKHLTLPELAHQVKANAAKKEVLERGLKQAQLDYKIGVSSAASGISIGLKALADIGLKIGLGIKGALSAKGFFGFSEVAAASVPATGATIGLGIAGTMVLGPVAGVFATLLGTYFTVKSVSKRNQLKNDFTVAQADLKANSEALRRAGTMSTSDVNYVKFIERQGEKRIHFFKKFAKWNQSFMVGSGLYAASAVTKAVVLGLALGGVAAAASNPIGLGLIVAVGILGAFAMGIGSYAFLSGHERQSKYARHTAGDHRMVGRHFLAGLQSVRYAKDYFSHELDIRQGAFELSILGQRVNASCLDWLDVRKSTLRELLNVAASQHGKLSPSSKKLTWWARVSGKTLNQTQLGVWLQTDVGKAEFKKLAVADLSAQITYLEHKLEAGLLLQKGLQLSPTSPQSKLSEQSEWVMDYVHVLSQVDQVLEQDQACLETARHLKSLFESEASFQHAASVKQNQLSHLLLEHWGFDTHGERAFLSKVLLKEMDKDLRNARGVLFESQLQASQLNAKPLLGVNVTT